MGEIGHPGEASRLRRRGATAGYVCLCAAIMAVGFVSPSLPAAALVAIAGVAVLFIVSAGFGHAANDPEVFWLVLVSSVLALAVGATSQLVTGDGNPGTDGQGGLALVPLAVIQAAGLGVGIAARRA